MIELSWMRVFVEAARSGSMTETASKLGMTQPAVSNILKKLERETGAAVYEHGKRRFTPTPLGEELLSRMRQIIALDDELNDSVMTWRLGMHDSLRLGSVTSFAVAVLPYVLVNFMRYHKRIALDCGYSSDLENALRQGGHDLAILNRSLEGDPDVTSSRLMTESYVAIAPKSIFKKDRVTFKDAYETLKTLPFAYLHRKTFDNPAVLKSLRQLGLAEGMRYEIESYDLIASLIAQGFAWTIIPPLTIYASPTGLEPFTIMNSPGEIGQKSFFLVSRSSQFEADRRVIAELLGATIRKRFLSDVRKKMPGLLPYIET